MTNLRPRYDLPLPSLDDRFTARGKIFSEIKEGSRVLDIGCDTGRFGLALKTEKRCIVDGIETDPSAIAEAVKRLDTVHERTITDESSFSGLENYDSVLLLDVLEHLQDPWAVLRGIFKVLAPGGTLSIVTPNVAHISVIRRLLCGSFEYTNYGTMDRTHLRWFTRKSLSRMLFDAGFNTVSIDMVPLIPRVNTDGPVRRALARAAVSFFPDLLGGSIIAVGRKPF